MGKRIYFILLMLMSWPMASFSQGSWELLFPSPTSNQMVGMYFIDDQTGWSVGEYGTILKTTDGGETWTIQEIPWLFDLCDVHFPTALIGYAIGTDGFIIKTTNGGESWEQLDNHYSNNLNRILFRDENNGWALGEKGLILHTSDGGASWKLQPTNNPYITFNGIDLIGTDGVIIVGGQNTILITNNDGQIWQPVSIDTVVTYVYSLEDVYFMDELHGWICGGAREHTALLKTLDGGQTWTRCNVTGCKYTDFSSFSDIGTGFLGPLQQIYFYDDMKTGIGLFKANYITDFGNIPMKTANGGRTWSTVMHGISEHYDGRGRFCVLDDNQIICTGYHGALRYSNNKGSSWYLSSEEQRWWKHLTIADNGQLLLHKHCIREYIPGGHIDQFARSTDYGTTWSEFEPVFLDSNDQELQQLTIDNPRFKFGEFVNNRDTLWSLQYADYNSKYIFISTDFGYTYKEVGRANNYFISAFLTPDTLIGYFFASREIRPNYFAPIFQFFYSLDRGTTVNMFESAELFNNLTFDGGLVWPSINGHYFFNGHKGFLVSSDGNIVKTEDTGQSWENIYSGVVEDLHDITFIDEQTGFVVGDFGRILKTDDGGMTWRKTNSGTQENVYSIGFINDHEGWVGTENGLRYTTDVGETWQGVPLRYSHGKIKNLTFDDAGNGYAYTYCEGWHTYMNNRPNSHQQLLRMRNSEIRIDVSNSETVAPHAITLFQNYPNPFNLSTVISYQLLKANDVTLSLFNLNGQLVQTLFSGNQNTGIHQVVWNSRNNRGQQVSSGIYIYQVKTEREVLNRKLTLLK